MPITLPNNSLFASKYIIVSKVAEAESCCIFRQLRETRYEYNSVYKQFLFRKWQRRYLL
jgi:hypothetical protein